MWCRGGEDRGLDAEAAMSDMERFVLGITAGGLFVVLMAVAAVLVSSPRRWGFVAGVLMMGLAMLAGVVFAATIT